MAVDRGALVIGDISGYTDYLTGVELEHSHDVIADLLDTMVQQAAGVLTLSKLEGVFQRTKPALKRSPAWVT